MQLEVGYVLFAATWEAIDEARDYIKRMGLTADDVRIVRSDDGINVKTKREIEWNISQNQ